MRPAVTSPTPGRVSSCSTVAVFRSSGADGVAGPAAASGGGGAGSPGPGTRTCSPSMSLRARLTASRSAPEVAPPAAAMASWTRLPAGRRTSPGWRTRPATWTATWPEGPDPAAPADPAPPQAPTPAVPEAPAAPAAEVSGTARGRVWPAGAAASWLAGPASRGVARTQTIPAPASATRTSRATATRWRPTPASTARTRARGPPGGRTNGGGWDMALPPSDRQRPSPNLAARPARRLRLSTPPPAAARPGSGPGDHVDDPARDVDHPGHPVLGGQAGHRLQGQGRPAHLVIAGVAGHGDLAPPPAVDRDREHHGRRDQGPPVGDGEGDVVQRLVVAEPLPELGGQVRGQRGHHQDQRLRRLAGSGALVPGVAGDGVVELDQPGHGHVVAQLPVQRGDGVDGRSEEHTSELQSPDHLVCRLLLEKKKKKKSEKKIKKKKKNIKTKKKI